MKRNNILLDNALAVTKIVKIFEENENEEFTNAKLSNLLKLSKSTVSQITSKLQVLGVIKICAFKKNKSNFTQIFQYSKGTGSEQKVYTLQENSVIKVSKLFKLNKVLSKEDIVDLLNISLEEASKALHVLLVVGSIKLVSIEKRAKFQHVLGAKKGLKVVFQLPKSYTTISNFVKTNKLSLKEEEKLKKLKTNIFLYCNKGVQKIYKVKSLENCINTKKSWIKITYNSNTNSWENN